MVWCSVRLVMSFFFYASIISLIPFSVFMCVYLYFFGFVISFSFVCLLLRLPFVSFLVSTDDRWTDYTYNKQKIYGDSLLRTVLQVQMGFVRKLN